MFRSKKENHENKIQQPYEERAELKNETMIPGANSRKMLAKFSVQVNPGKKVNMKLTVGYAMCVYVMTLTTWRIYQMLNELAIWNPKVCIWCVLLGRDGM